MSSDILASLALKDWKRIVVAKDYDLKHYKDSNVSFIYNITSTLSLLQQTKETQSQDDELREILNIL